MEDLLQMSRHFTDEDALLFLQNLYNQRDISTAIPDHAQIPPGAHI